MSQSLQISGISDEDTASQIETSSALRPTKEIPPKIILSFGGLTTPPLYHPKYPATVKYDGIGTLIGHKIYCICLLRYFERFDTKLNSSTLKSFHNGNTYTLCVSEKCNKTARNITSEIAEQHCMIMLMNLRQTPNGRK